MMIIGMGDRGCALLSNPILEWNSRLVLPRFPWWSSLDRLNPTIKLLQSLRTLILLIKHICCNKFYRTSPITQSLIKVNLWQRDITWGKLGVLNWILLFVFTYYRCYTSVHLLPCSVVRFKKFFFSGHSIV